MPPLRDSGAGPEAERPEYAGHYRLEARLGSGGMGVVHLARSSSGLLLAVKVIHAEFAQDPEFRGRFRQEVAAARRVSGAFTAPVVDADPDAERPWMATLHIPGPTLSDHVKRKGPMAPDEVRRLACGLAEALRDIHRAGVVHRDLKPGNVLLAADGPKVIDFGISRPSDSEMRTETGKLIGTPPFMAPEQFQRPREVGPAADVFALGSVLVHAATGSGPFDSESPYLVAYQVVHDEADLTGVPDELAPLIESCLAKDPADRPTPDLLMRLLHSELDPELHAGLPTELHDRLLAPAPAPDARIPAQRQPVRAESAPSRAEATHVRAGSVLRSGVGTDAETDTGADAGSAAESAAGATARGGVHTDSPASRPGSPTSRADSRTGTAAGDAAPSAGAPATRPARRHWPLWAAVALLLAGAGGFMGVRALMPGAADHDPALQTHPPSEPRTAFHPWRTTLLKRPAGHRAEIPFCTAGSGAVFCTQPGVRAARLDADTGRVVWRSTGGPATARAPRPPVLSGGLLYVFSPDSKRVTALDPSVKGKGAVRWSQDLTRYEGGARVVGDRVLLADGDGTVTALDSATHRQRWHKRFAGHQQALFTAFGDARTARTAYAADNAVDSSHTQVTAIDPEDGSVHWARRLPGSLTLAGTGSSGTLYFIAVDPQSPFITTAVVSYDPHTKRTRRIPLTAPLEGTVAAVVRGETVYLLAEGGSLRAVGERAWDVETSVSRVSAPVVSGNRLYFTAGDGRLLALDTRNGSLLGQTPPQLAADRHNGFLSSLPAPVVDARGGQIYATAPNGTVFGTATKDPADW
ncbi:serine/threonine-protein kinase [Streptomyces sp. NPDC048483]|uniref:serine/threonine-protein kinase n=1 Tax=Streptomyces sp. NPDC048483 TaxID=3154927 RepID=UPI00343B75E6